MSSLNNITSALLLLSVLQQEEINENNPQTLIPIHSIQQSVTRRKISKKSIIYPLVAWFLFLILTILHLIFVCPWYYQNVSKIVPILHGLFVFYVGQNFFQAMCMDPGRYHPCPNDQHSNESRLRIETNSYSIRKINFEATICTTCFIVKPPRTHHCRNCGYCIDIMDHHCPWLCNCVGRRNYRFFLLFLFTLLIHINITFTCSLHLIVSLREDLVQVKVFISLLLVLCTTLLAGPAGGLFGLHVILVSKSITTFEQVTGKFLNVAQTPFHDGILNNWLRICCTSVMPKLDRYSTNEHC